MKVIFITGYWKSGTTLLQFLLARSKNIHNVFPRKGINYDGTEFWRKYIPLHTTNNGHYIPNRLIDKIDTNAIRKKINEYSNDSEYILLKRPQFVMNNELIHSIFDDVKIIATKRELLPNIYSMLRMRKLNEYPDNVVVGQYLPGWKRMKSMPPIDRLVKQYCYVNNYISEYIDAIEYKTICNNTKRAIGAVEELVNIDHPLDIDIPDITNCNTDYLNGTSLTSKNDNTIKGNFSVIRDNKNFPPLTTKEIDKINECYERYKDIDVI